MTLQEFSLEFDILYNNVTSNSAPPLDEYEKSVFLTMAQLEIVKELYSGRNQLGLAVEVNEESRHYLNSLIYTATSELTEDDANVYEKYKEYKIDPNYEDISAIAILREYISYSVNDKVKEIPVIPISHDTIFSTLQNPFRGTSHKRALKTEVNNHYRIYWDKPDNINDATFTLTYLTKPTPIILENIDTSEYLTIDGEDVYGGKECILPEVLHGDILKRAVQLAKQTYVGQTQE